MTHPNCHETVVVTGSSTGIGKAITLALDAEGFQVFAGVRKQGDGVALSREASPRLKPLHLDVTNESSITAAVEVVRTANNGAVHGLVNNNEVNA